MSKVATFVIHRFVDCRLFHSRLFAMRRRSSGGTPPSAVPAVPGVLGVLAVLTVVAAVAPVEYTNDFAVVVAGGWQRAERVAEKHGCVVKDSVRIQLVWMFGFVRCCLWVVSQDGFCIVCVSLLYEDAVLV